MNAKNESESAERREAPRLPIGLPVELERGNGWTRDISASGVFFETDESFTPGAPIRFSLLLEHVYPSPFRLECKGQIVRVERRDGKLGAAAAINSYRLIPQARQSGMWHEWPDGDRPAQGRRPQGRPDLSQDLALVTGEVRRPTVRRVKEYLSRFHAGGLRLQWVGVMMLGLAVALAGCGQGKGSQVSGASVTAAEHLAGQNADTSTCGQVTLSWAADPGGATQYQVQVFGQGNVLQNEQFVTGTTVTLSLPPGSYTWRVKVFGQDQGGFADGPSFTVVACTGCGTPGWLPPVTLSPTVKQPSTLPIKFCPQASFTAATATGTLTKPDSSNESITFTRTDDGIYIFLFRSRGQQTGTYTVTPPAGVGFTGTASFTVIP